MRRSGGRRARLRRRSAAAGFEGRQGAVLGREPSRMGRVLLGLPDRRHHRRAHRLSVLARVRVESAWPGRRESDAARRRCRTTDGQTPIFRRSWQLADLDWQADGPMPAVAVSRDDIIADHLYIWRHSRPERRRHSPSQRDGEHRPGRTRDPEVPEVCAAVPSAPISQSPAPEPHVRAVDGHEHPADGAGHRDLHAQLQPARHPRLIKSRRISVLVCVPKMLDVLREHAMRAWPEAARGAARRASPFQDDGGGIDVPIRRSG